MPRVLAGLHHPKILTLNHAPSSLRPPAPSPVNLPPSNLENCRIKDVLVSPGCTIQDSHITDSIIGSRSQIGKGCTISGTRGRID